LKGSLINGYSDKTLPGLTGVLFAVQWRMRSVSVVFMREEPNVSTGDVDLLLRNILIEGILTCFGLRDRRVSENRRIKNLDL
jgi:hypothetical protein